MLLFLSRLSRFFGSTYWFLVSVCIFIVLLWLSWQVLKLQNFHYSLWYDWLDIKQHIELYGPQNIYYLGLEHLAKTEHVALFSYIVIIFFRPRRHYYYNKELKKVYSINQL